MSIELLPEFIRENYELHEWKHSCAILKEDFPEEWKDIISVLHEFRLYNSSFGVHFKQKIRQDIK